MATRGMPSRPKTGDGKPNRNSPQWVDAAPFRAHVAHLMAAADLSVGTLAQLVGAPPQAVARLMVGRDTGRPLVKRISRDMARQLLQVRNSDVRALRWRSVDAVPVTRRLHLLRRSGWSESRLAAALGVDRGSLSALLDGSASRCTALVAARAAAAVRAIETAGSDKEHAA